MEHLKTSKEMIWMNGDYMSPSKPVLKVSDLGLQRGYGVFDFFRFVGARPFLWDHYFQRFRNSAQALDLEIDYSTEELKEVCLQLAGPLQPATIGMKLTLTGGYSADGYTPGSPNLIISPHILHLPPPKKYERGFNIISHCYQREMPFVKTTNYLRGIKMLSELKASGADDVLYHSGGVITELPRSNFFLVKEGQLITPANNILKGITRKSILTLHEVEETEIHLEMLSQADEAFLTSTTKGIMPIAQIDGKALRNEVPGPVTRKIMAAFNDLRNLCPAAIP